MTAPDPKIVLLGGGTGSFTLLQKLKDLTPHITAIVNMSDDGGSTGSLRDEYGVLPPGDARQCLVALSDAPEIRDLFSYRFSQGAMKGHTVGNLILSALEMQYGSFAKALQVAADILRITGRVVPVTLDNHTLIAVDGGHTYRGERIIDGDISLSKDAVLRLEPAAALNPEAKEAIESADMVVIAPGSLHSSLLPILAVSGMAEALAATNAPVVWVANLVNKPHQTDDWHVVDYVHQFEKYVGEGVIHTVLYNTQPITPRLLKKYAAEGEFPVRTDAIRFSETGARVIGTRLVSADIAAQARASAEAHRTLIRHDPTRVMVELKKLLNG